GIWGSHFETLSSRLTFFSSTSLSSSVDTYEIATAPLRKCMAVVAGTPVIESPKARVMISLPSTVTRTMTARRWRALMLSCTTFVIASPMAGLVERTVAGGAAALVEPPDDDDVLSVDEQATALTTTHTATAPMRRRRDLNFINPPFDEHRRGVTQPLQSRLPRDAR